MIFSGGVKRYQQFVFQHWQALLFTCARYLELGCLAIAIMICAKKIGPEEMSNSIPIFLYITYANYLGLGGTLILYKRYLLSDEWKKIELFNTLLRLFLCSALAAFILAVIFLKPEYAFWTFGISFCTYFRALFECYLRLVERIVWVAVNDILLSTFMILSTFFFVESFRQYLILFFLGKLLTLLLYSYNMSSYLILRIRDLVYQRISWSSYFFFCKEGVRLSLLSLCSTILLSIDKFFVNKFRCDQALKGSYQLAEMIASILYVLLAGFGVYYFPKLIIFLQEKKNEKKYLDVLLKIAFSIPLVMVLFYLFCSYIVSPIFKNYGDWAQYTFFLSGAKIGVFILVMLANIYIAANKEMFFVANLSILVIIIGVVDFILYYLNSNIGYLPLVSFLSIVSGMVLFFIVRGRRVREFSLNKVV